MKDYLFLILVTLVFNLSFQLELLGQQVIELSTQTITYPGGIDLKAGDQEGIRMYSGVKYMNDLWTVTEPNYIELYDQDGDIRMNLTGWGPKLNFNSDLPLINQAQDIITINNTSNSSARWDIGVSTDFEYNSFLDFKFNGTLVGYMSQSGITSTSDRKLKREINILTDVLPRLILLSPSQYERIAAPGKSEYGFIAQELNEVFPEVITRRNTKDGELYMVNYTQMIPINTRAIQEQQAIIEQQADLIQKLIRRIEILEVKLEN